MQSRRQPDPGTQALLVPLNFVLTFCAVLPFLAVRLLPFIFASMRVLGAFSLLTGLILLGVVLPEIGKAGTIVCAAVLLPASIFLPWMLVARKIPWWLKLLTTALELPAFWLMYITVEKLHLEYLRGAFKGMML
jgi:hypothetical protein